VLLVGTRSRLTPRRHAIILWASSKFILGFFTLIFLTAGIPVSFFMHDPGAWELPALVLVWGPGIEFFPRVTPRQRYATLARLVFSLVIIGYGIAVEHIA